MGSVPLSDVEKMFSIIMEKAAAHEMVYVSEKPKVYQLDRSDGRGSKGDRKNQRGSGSRTTKR